MCSEECTFILFLSSTNVNNAKKGKVITMLLAKWSWCICSYAIRFIPKKTRCLNTIQLYAKFATGNEQKKASNPDMYFMYVCEHGWYWHRIINIGFNFSVYLLIPEELANLQEVHVCLCVRANVKFAISVSQTRGCCLFSKQKPNFFIWLIDSIRMQVQLFMCRL